MTTSVPTTEMIECLYEPRPDPKIPGREAPMVIFCRTHGVYGGCHPTQVTISGMEWRTLHAAVDTYKQENDQLRRQNRVLRKSLQLFLDSGDCDQGMRDWAIEESKRALSNYADD